MVGPGMKRISVVFQSPFHVDVTTDEVPEPGSGEVLVQAGLAAISAGTELLVFAGSCPRTCP